MRIVLILFLLTVIYRITAMRWLGALVFVFILGSALYGISELIDDWVEKLWKVKGDE